MRIKKVWALYFSGTGTTEKTVRRIAAGMAQALDAELAVYDFTTPAARQRELRFNAEELAVLGVPVYAGRVPNVLLPYLTKQLHGGGALAARSWASTPSPARWARGVPTGTIWRRWILLRAAQRRR